MSGPRCLPRLKVEHVIPEGGGSAIIGDFEEPYMAGH